MHNRKRLVNAAEPEKRKAEILLITSYPPRECGIATYSQDLVKALNNKFSNSLSIKVCALESGVADYIYPEEVKMILDTTVSEGYLLLASSINIDKDIQVVLIQHEFGFFRKQEEAFLEFINSISKPVVIVFHSVLPYPDQLLKSKVGRIVSACESVIVMTHNSAEILHNDYNVPEDKISIIAHGTHLVPRLDVEFLKMKYGLKGKKVLTTFGLLSPGKSIETTLEALPEIIKSCPEAMFLIIGKTHPEVVKSDGETYREMLEALIQKYSLQDHVIFINKYLALPDLLEYLQLTDIYLFTTNDPNQAVSGTFAYAMSCACAIISTPIPHAREFLNGDTGIIFDFGNAVQLAESTISLLKNDKLRRELSLNALQKIVSTAWENSAVSHAMLIGKIVGKKYPVNFDLPSINLDHFEKMSTEFGMIQFSKTNQPDIHSGYTLDDNARALVVSCMYYKLTGYEVNIRDIRKYLQFIHYCQQPEGEFLNYVNENNEFTAQNQEVNLDDSNGRAVWALGYVISLKDVLPADIVILAETILEKCLPGIINIHSTRAMAFAVKGLSYYYIAVKSREAYKLVEIFSQRLVQMYKHESNEQWDWFEGYLTYANSILPEALLHAYSMTGETSYRDIAVSSFEFLLSQTFNENGIEVISNKEWRLKGTEATHFGEQPIDVAYTIMTLGKFYEVFKKKDYLAKMETAFNWFLGSNRLKQIVYNPCTGGCYDGLEENHVNLNQGAESTLSYLMARLTIEKYRNLGRSIALASWNHLNIQKSQYKFLYSTNSLKLPDFPNIISLPLRLE
ncbi:MAG: glycosyltransferase [Bacteroidetes bacterium]|nr:glycosyltransferase [Bacteroidota bacterium]